MKDDVDCWLFFFHPSRCVTVTHHRYCMSDQVSFLCRLRIWGQLQYPLLSFYSPFSLTLCILETIRCLRCVLVLEKCSDVVAVAVILAGRKWSCRKVLFEKRTKLGAKNPQFWTNWGAKLYLWAPRFFSVGKMQLPAPPPLFFNPRRR